MTSRSQSGGALVVVLLALVLAAALTAGWLSTVTAETKYAEALEEASRRRIAFANLDAIARQYMLTNVLSFTHAAGVTEIADSSLEVEIIEAGSPLTSEAVSAVNPFNPGNGDGYTFDVVITGGVSDPGDFRRLYCAKSRSPVLSGDLFISNRPSAGSNSVFGALSNSQRAMLWAPDGNTYSLATESYTVAPTAASAVTLSNAAGDAVIPSNFPFVPTSTGQLAGAAIYNGQLDVVANASGINSLALKAANEGGAALVNGADAETSTGNGVTSDGAGVVTVDLLSETLRNLHLVNVTELVLDGQATTEEAVTADFYVGILIYLDDASALTTVRLVGRNARRLALGIRSVASTGVTFDASGSSASWRLVLTLENTPTTWLVPAGDTLEIFGGIQSDRNVAIDSGSVSLLTEPDAKLLDRLTARDVWLEAYDPPEVAAP